ncbi:HAD hydrolase-like protein [Thiomicrorhabdus xiamenensis]|uniref:HAD hydrolase-like protein n=1 Tax=Thiomicrorhabdus xiamenensis TaxID=2739063 RepID=UPI001EEC57FB|nr:HAD hydrolase-like protein [Thiomicrorhabdus xiamenensis]
MLQSIEKALGCSLQGAPMVGDTLGDLKAALRQGMRPHLVRSGKGERTLSTQDPVLQSIPVHVNLLALVRHLLAEENL